jgi:beta-galactosidase
VDRREFLKSSAALLAAARLPAKAETGPDAKPSAASAGRILFPLNRNWRYSAQRVENHTGRDFDDSGFQQVTLPHANVRLPWHSFDEKAYQFVSVYRRHF